MSGWSPCQFLKHPTSRKVAPQRRNPVLCQGTVDFHPCSPLCPELPISRHRTWGGMRPVKLNAIYHSKPCAHFMLIILEGCLLSTVRWVMKKRLN